jgi:8-oxo-dGTP pyrophosphatase MutT (NUDIX family)
VKKWIVKESEYVLDTRWMKVRRDKCLLPTGETVEDYYLWQGKDFVMIFGLTSDDKVILVRQYKHGAQDIMIELPAGQIDDSDTNPLNAAIRELREETGYEAEDYTHLIDLFVASANSTVTAHLYLATGLTQITSPQLDNQELIESLSVSVTELMQMVTRGEIRDVNSIAAIFLALRKLNLIPEKVGVT